MPDEATDRLKLMKAARAHRQSLPFCGRTLSTTAIPIAISEAFVAGTKWQARELNEHLREVSGCPPDASLECWLGILSRCVDRFTDAEMESMGFTKAGARKEEEETDVD